MMLWNGIIEWLVLNPVLKKMYKLWYIQPYFGVECIRMYIFIPSLGWNL